MEKEIKEINVISAANILGVVHFAMGIFIGVIYFLISLAMPAEMFEAVPWMRYMFGVGSLVIMPLASSVMGWISGAVSSLVYNLVAERIGGLKLRFAEE